MSTLRFPYTTSSGAGRHAHPLGTTHTFRPLVPITIIGPTGTRAEFPNALVDTGAFDTVFHHDVGKYLDVKWRRLKKPHVLRWRGTAYPLEYGDVTLKLTDQTSTLEWQTPVGFTRAPIPFDAFLGYYGCLQYLDATFKSANLLLELEANSLFPTKYDEPTA